MESRAAAVRVIVLFGLVSLFADATYEGARALHGPFLLSLGASATTVGLIAGTGELIGFGLRLASGLLADRTRRYWLLTILGYGVNVVAVPALAFAGGWPLVAALVVLERTGKSLRAPARDVMLSEAAEVVGAGWGFGLHAAMDQAGAIAGPLAVAAIYAARHDYRLAFLWLAVPAAITVALLFAAKFLHARSGAVSHTLKAAPVPARHFPVPFWIYVAAAGLLALGYADFALIGFHFTRTGLIGSAASVPVLYALAMGVNAVGALVFGRWFDARGIESLIGGTVLAAVSLPLCFASGSAAGAWAGVAAWGAGMGAIDAVLRAGISKLVSMHKRGTAFGIFNAAYGVAWFLGSVAMGWLYDGLGTGAVIAFGALAQAGAIAMFVWYGRLVRRNKGQT